jgi:hypothetical protein
MIHNRSLCPISDVSLSCSEQDGCQIKLATQHRDHCSDAVFLTCVNQLTYYEYNNTVRYRKSNENGEADDSVVTDDAVDDASSGRDMFLTAELETDPSRHVPSSVGDGTAGVTSSSLRGTKGSKRP